jgi:tetratricopeptide (TPR) repeat protein
MKNHRAARSGGNADRDEPRASNVWTSREAYLLAIACFVIGLAIGYIFRGSSGGSPPQGGAGSASPPAQSTTPLGTALTPWPDVETAARPLKSFLQANPNDYDTLVKLGNLYFDYQHWGPAIEQYSRALAIRPNVVEVRTDRGTAYFYSQQFDQAKADYERSLKVNPTHAQTLFNYGLLQLNGLRDPAAAIELWQRLLRAHPNYPEAARVAAQIEQAKLQLGRR